MAHRNNVTGDLIFDKKPTQAYLDNYEKIFGKKESKEEDKTESSLPKGDQTDSE